MQVRDEYKKWAEKTRSTSERIRSELPTDIWNTPSDYWTGNGKPKCVQFDFETYSEVDIGKCGSYRYIEDDSFEALMLAVAFDDEPVFIIDIACGEEIPDIVWAAIYDDEIIKSAWNAQFERTILGKLAGEILSPDSWRCSMVWAASLSLPLALKNAALVLKTGEQKDKAGENLIRYFSIPCKPTKSNGLRTRNLPEHAPVDWQMFKEYCLQDVRTERDIRKKLDDFPLPDHEWDFYHMDQRINDRGVLIDKELATQAITCDLILSDEMTKRAYELTGLENPNSVSQLKSWLDERGIDIDSLGKKNVEELIKDLDKHSLDSEALEMMKLRLQMAKSSVKKYQAADRCMCSDNRARGLFQFAGANRTARWAGRLLQIHNLKQNHLSTLDEARELVRMGCFDMVESIYGNTPDVLSQLIRTMLIPKEGHEFIVADFSAIEARVLAWLSGEQWRIDAFNKGEDIYCASASHMFGVPVVKHGINGELRQRGKVAELACLISDSLVLTDHGLVPIQNVTKEMKLWDGEEWVNHDGVIYRGEKEVITYDGLTATPDHLVWVEGESSPIRFEDAIQKNAHLLHVNNCQQVCQDKRNVTGLNPHIAKVYDIRNAGRHHRFTVSGRLVHNCGYGGSIGALTNMGALEMGLKEDELQGLIDDWRNSNPNIVQFWWNVEKAATETIDDHQERTVGRIGFQFSANTLWIVLPSGRKLAYIKPQLQPNKFGRLAITFEGLNAANKWDRGETYSGRLVENITQATARDLLAEAMWRIEQAGLNIVGHVHDEVILEVPKDSITVYDVCEIMSQNPSWADGLPLASDGYRGSYYFKS